MFALALPLFCIVLGRNIIKEDLNDALVYFRDFLEGFSQYFRAVLMTTRIHFVYL